MAARTNRTEKLDDALKAWEHPDHLLNRATVDLHTTAAGNINSTGNLGDYSGYMLARHHAMFLQSIESGVRPLVSAIIAKGWITYSSCEGHHYLGFDLTPVERHVGILPRSPSERERMLDLFDVIRRTLEIQSPQPLHVGIHQIAIDSDTSSREAIEVCFERDPSASWQAYFAHLDAFCDAFIALFEKSGP